MSGRCFVCDAGPPKYRFRCCRQRYCSVPCYRAHAVAGCTAQPPAAADNFRKRKRQEDDDDDEENLISEVRLCAMRGHAGIRDVLRSDRFRDLLRQLDSADDRQAALEALLENDSFFVKFAEHALEAIDYKEP